MCELLWSDPHPGEGRVPSKRGVGVAFGADVTRRFLAANKLDLLVRSHEVNLHSWLSPSLSHVSGLPMVNQNATFRPHCFEIHQDKNAVARDPSASEDFCVVGLMRNVDNWANALSSGVQLLLKLFWGCRSRTRGTRWSTVATVSRCSARRNTVTRWTTRAHSSDSEAPTWCRISRRSRPSRTRPCGRWHTRRRCSEAS